MRFDLEINIVSALTVDGLELASDVIYGDSDIVNKMSWDTKTISPNVNSGNISTSNYDKINSISPDHFVSGLTAHPITVNSEIKYDGLSFIAFNGGEIYSYRYPTEWSAHTIVQQTSFKDGYYQYTLDSDTDISSIKVYTLANVYPGQVIHKKEYTYVEYNGNSIAETFAGSSESYQFTVLDNIVYLNSKQIEYSNTFIGKCDGTNLGYALPEFPTSNLVVTNFSSTDYDIKNGILLFKRGSIIENEDVIVSYSVSPIITFKQQSRSQERPDIVFTNKNITPKSLNFNNGTVCAFAGYGGQQIPTSISLELDNSDPIGYTDSVKVTANLFGHDGIPLENKLVTIDITSDNGIWQESSSRIYTGRTSIDGTLTATAYPGDKKVGNYIQKEWINNITIDGVTKGQITIPYRLPSLGDNIDPNTLLGGIYLYQITSDDPILGKTYNYSYENGIQESYSDATLESYQINGRKSAYIALRDSDGKIYSKFIKPSKIEVKSETAMFRNLYVGDDSSTILGYITDAQLVSKDTSIVNNGAYDTGVLPNDCLNVYSKRFDEVTVITYDEPFPLSSEIIAMWMATDRIVNVQASYQDEYTNIKSESKSISVRAMESEFAFVLSGSKLPGYNVNLNDFGYLTITEYLKNPFGLTSCSYYCIYSDAIDKKCIHKTQAYHKYFTIDEGNIGCKHTPEYDAMLDPELRCPGLNAQIINPFILPTES